MLTLRQFVGCMAVLLSLLMTTGIEVCAQQRSLQKGKASYYSKRINGHKTSSGERLNNDSLVCAHRTHPFGTKLLVKNPANGKEIIVRVIDRGPFVKGRIIDLSYEAARQLGMLSAGIAMVEVSVYDDTEIPYKPKEYSMPELELEINNGGDGIVPEWQKKESSKHNTTDKDKAHHKDEAKATDEAHKENVADKSNANHDSKVDNATKQSVAKKSTSTTKRKTSAKKRRTSARKK